MQSLGKIIAEAYTKVGKDGVVLWKSLKQKKLMLR